MTVEFETTDYQMEYGHGPRGFGYWAFSFVGRNPTDVCDKQQVLFVNPAMTYGAAKKIARDEAQRRSVSRVVVLT